MIERLIDEGVISAESIASLTNHHADDPVTGLLVDEVIEEEVLLEQLAIHYETPPAGYRDGLFVERDVLERLDPGLIRRYQIIPVRRRQDSRIDVVVVEPLNDLAHQIIEEELGKPLRQYIWPRLRFLQAQHFFLGDHLSDQFRDYLRHYPVCLGYASSDDEIDIQQALQSSASLPVTQWHRQDVQNFITSCFDRDTLLKVLLGYANHWLTNRLIVIFAKGGILPYFIEEWPQLSERFDEVEALRQIWADLPDDSPLSDKSQWQSGTADELGLTELFENFDVSAPQLCISFPVVIGGRTAMSLIGVPTIRSAAVRLEDVDDEFNLQGLLDATAWVGDQLEEIIKRAKAGTLPPPAERIPSLPRPQIQLGLGVEESLVEHTLAKRRRGQKRHRWEIVDISQVIEDSSAPSEDIADESSVVEAIAQALSEVEDEEPSVDESPADDEQQEIRQEEVHQEMDTGATTFGMPALQLNEESSELLGEQGPTSETEIKEGSKADSEAEVDQAWSGILSEVSERDDLEEMVAQSDLGDEQSDEVIPEAVSKPGSKIDPNHTSPEEKVAPVSGPSVTPEVPELDRPTSDELIAKSSVDDDARPEEVVTPTTGDDFRVEPESEEPQDPQDLQESEDSEDFKPAVDDEPKEQYEVEADAEVDVDTEDKVAQTSGPSQLNIPTSRSGVPMAQILRRPKSVREARAQTGVAEASEAGASESFDADEQPVTGQTIMGLGDISSLRDMVAPKNSESEGLDDSSWLDEVEAGAEPSDPSARPSGTIKMNSEASQTQSFSELLEDMESESQMASTHLGQPNSVGKQLTVDHKPSQTPQTVPVDAIEEISDTGPQAVEIEESLALLDSRDRDTAYAAAEHLAVAGKVAIKALTERFPGRIFVDRYQYNLDSMPAVSEHGPLLEALVRIGSDSLKIVERYIDDSSLQRRFYATYLLTELPAHNLLKDLQKRLFDRDQQTRDMAGRIVHAHRHLPDFEELITAPLRQTLESSDEEFRVEIAAAHLRRLRDIKSVGLLIDALLDHPPRVRDIIYSALKEITFQPLAPSPSEWRRWWFDAAEQPRWEWLVEAMNNDDEAIRLLAFDEISQLPGLELNYHPNQPKKLRSRAQGELTRYFEELNG